MVPRLLTRLAIVTVIAGVAIADEPKPSEPRGIVRGTITVKRAEGVTASPILVYIVGFSEPAPETTAAITQEKRSFVPDLVAVTVGQTVSFPNKDPLFHNVFSPGQDRFDLGSFKKGDTKTRQFSKAGVLEVYCNIHPEMSATLIVLPNRKFVIADAKKGTFEIPDVPVGKWQVFAYSRRAAKPTKVEVTVTANGTTTADLKLDEVKRDFMHTNKYGEKYKSGPYPE